MRLKIEDRVHDEGRGDVVEGAEFLWSKRVVGRRYLETDRSEDECLGTRGGWGLTSRNEDMSCAMRTV